MEGLNFDNLLGAEEIEDLFAESSTPETEEKKSEETSEKTETEEETTEASSEDLFGDTETEQPESVGSEDNEGTGDTSTGDEGTSPDNNFYSSIANAMAVDGIFPNLDEDTLKGVVDAETLSEAFEQEVKARYDEGQRRILEALNNGVEPSDIRRYEGTLDYLNKLTDQMLTAEDAKGEELRSQLIFQDFINRGMSREKAQKLTKRSIDDGNDLEDAKEALQSNKDFFHKEYQKLLDEAQVAAEKEKAEQKKRAEKMKKSIMEDKTLLGNMEISNDLRKRAFEKISKPVYKDPETGEYLTSIQRYEQEHPDEFVKNIGLIMTLTNDFKDFDSFVKGKVKVETRKGLKELERALSNTKRDIGGNLKMVTSAKDDPESYIGAGFKLAL